MILMDTLLMHMVVMEAAMTLMDILMAAMETMEVDTILQPTVATITHTDTVMTDMAEAMIPMDILTIMMVMVATMTRMDTVLMGMVVIQLKLKHLYLKVVGIGQDTMPVSSIQQVENHGGIVIDQAHVTAPLELLISEVTAIDTILTSISPLVITGIVLSFHAQVLETFDNHFTQRRNHAR